ncbi:MAG: orotidine-5'-phosphate decarboxylase [Spirochaetales bacterium]
MKTAPDFFSELEASCLQKSSLLCVGLDPRVEAKTPQEARKAIVAANRALIEATTAVAAAYKPNSAFYEAWGPEGLWALEETLALIPEGTPVILDAKRGDIGPTAEAYARASFRNPKVGCVTIAPWMGRDSADPFLKHEGKGVFVLARTSNPSAGELQDLPHKGDPLYRKAARIAAGWDRRVGLVVAGNDEAALELLREALPQTWFLAPGVGAQGGTVKGAVSAGIRADGLGLLVNVSREIAQAENPAQKATELRDQINLERAAVLGRRLRDPATMTKLKRKVLEGLIRTECFQLGEFILKSGLKSPFYVDLRRVASDPKVLKLVGKAYAQLMRDLDFHCVAGIPLAALPLATAASLQTGTPLIYPRIPPKPHGTGNNVEGEFKKGDKALLLDDLITTGKSKLEAIDVLRAEGLVVKDLVVLLERGVQGRRDMDAQGVRLHAFAQIEEFFTVAKAMGLIDSAKEAELLAFTKAN